jgi:uncharacterized protein (DUF2141 family)
MPKLKRYTIAAALLAGGGPATAGAVVPATPTCARGPAALVHVDGLKVRSGTLRVQVYGSEPTDFLAKGRWLKRVELPVPGQGRPTVCVALPKTGTYAIAVRHDVDGQGKSGWNDGGGFSRNPKLSLFDYKPKFAEVAIAVGDGPRQVDVVMNYREGLSIRPVR